jgi:HTH-type transcriptional regulator/antitoxin HipB
MRQVRTPWELGNAVRGARTDRGWSQVELAERAGVGRPWLSELEGGKRTAEIGRILAVIDALGLALEIVNVAPPSGRVDLDALD